MPDLDIKKHRLDMTAEESIKQSWDAIIEGEKKHQAVLDVMLRKDK